MTPEVHPLGYGSAVILGLVQGLTEFLPISSKGHLILTERLLGVNVPGIGVEVSLHIGTLVAVVIYYRRDLLATIVAIPAALGSLVRARIPADPAGRLILTLVLGTLPAAVAGVLFKSRVEEAFKSTRLTLVLLAVTGVFLQTIRWSKGTRKEATLRDSLLVGCAQAVALLPGISRSASTITAGVHAGLTREAAARYSFLLSIPAVLGAVVLSVPDIIEASRVSSAGGDAAGAATGGLLSGPIVAGILVAFVSGLAAIRILLIIAGKNRLELFSWYLWTVSALGLLFLK